jgi:excisionase family DNA binding protein
MHPTHDYNKITEMPRSQDTGTPKQTGMYMKQRSKTQKDPQIQRDTKVEKIAEPKPPLPERRTLSIKEAGAILGLSTQMAYAFAAKGEIPTIRLGKKLLVPKAALDRLLGETV